MAKSKVGVRGFFRIQATEDGKVIGDSGWKENQMLNNGIRDYIVNGLLNNSPIVVSHMGVGTGGAPASNDTTLAGQPTNSKRAAVSTSLVASGTAQFTAAFNSSDSFLTASANISNVGLVNQSATAGGTFLCGAAFASSAIATNNNLNITYFTMCQVLVTAFSKLRKLLETLVIRVSYNGMPQMA